jgi:glycosyltransferase involved in cell wall biosynthesis
MKVSVLIPAYNCAATIGATLESVLCQTAPADEILVMDDGSSDETATILKLYEPRIKMFRQPNGGPSIARNALIARAQGDLIAFLDSDDLWHPRYLQMQRKLFELHPDAAALFIGHENFFGLGSYDWGNIHDDRPVVELFDPSSFLRRFRTAPGHFVPSFCCVPKRVLDGMGSEPFKLRLAQDVYLFNLLPFWGPVAFVSAPLLGAYRVREGSIASNRLDCVGDEVSVFELLKEHYRKATDLNLIKEFERTFPSKRRAYAKHLLGVGRTLEARNQLRRSFSHSSDPVSLAKSFALLSVSYLPRPLQPKWPSVHRQ